MLNENTHDREQELLPEVKSDWLGVYLHAAQKLVDGHHHGIVSLKQDKLLGCVEAESKLRHGVLWYWRLVDHLV